MTNREDFPPDSGLHAASFWTTLRGQSVSCSLCAHRCDIEPGRWGVCGVRENRDGRLVTHAYGQVAAAAVDPIEKKPFYHFLPGTSSFSLAVAGCNFRCGFCQNWQISQSRARDHHAVSGRFLSPQEAVRIAHDRDCQSLSFTYTEPTVFFEYAFETASVARSIGLANTFVTNGYMTAEALAAIRPFLDAANVDLKSFRDETYKKTCGGRLQPVLNSIGLMRRFKIWVEVTTLVVPGLNDDETEWRDIARFLAGVDHSIPWHLSRFHPDYEYTHAPATPPAALRRAAEIGREEGLRFVYVGNVAGEEDPTLCPNCGRVLIRRRGFSLTEFRLEKGCCPDCREKIPGVFSLPSMAGPGPGAGGVGEA